MANTTTIDQKQAMTSPTGTTDLIATNGGGAINRLSISKLCEHLSSNLTAKSSNYLYRHYITAPATVGALKEALKARVAANVSGFWTANTNVNWETVLANLSNDDYAITTGITSTVLLDSCANANYFSVRISYFDRDITFLLRYSNGNWAARKMTWSAL